MNGGHLSFQKGCGQRHDWYRLKTSATRVQLTAFALSLETPKSDWRMHTSIEIGQTFGFGDMETDLDQRCQNLNLGERCASASGTFWISSTRTVPLSSMAKHWRGMVRLILRARIDFGHWRCTHKSCVSDGFAGGRLLCCLSFRVDLWLTCKPIAASAMLEVFKRETEPHNMPLWMIYRRRSL